MDILDMRCFAALAETGSFTRAAQSLYLTQPSFSRRINDMEQELGLSLVSRTTRTVRLTKEGALLLERFRQILALVDGVYEEAALLAQGRDRSLRIAYESFTGGPHRGRSSWDLIAVLYAVCPQTPHLRAKAHGTIRYDASLHRMLWQENGPRQDALLVQTASDRKLAEYLEKLLYRFEN